MRIQQIINEITSTIVTTEKDMKESKTVVLESNSSLKAEQQAASVEEIISSLQEQNAMVNELSKSISMFRIQSYN